MRASRQVVERILSENQVVYGINTGFGNFRNVIIPRPDLERLQTNLIRSHAAGVGDPFTEDVVRASIDATGFAWGSARLQNPHFQKLTNGRI